MTKVSIAIPTWENNGRGVEFLDDLIRTIEIQTLTDYEVIVSDHSENNDIKNVVKHYDCLLYTSPSPRDRQKSRMPSSA